ncbi:13823_t:CDS:2 [Acaulospora colombiana]|uniref:13823_t:CDS:1 n=1 Tax=Acaulospora colombiana TaxID=27376 RepID=A0ACA9K7I2_9GLOM|nr:13823_t:CDS:2 [Acaulospora colombiana]
MVNPEWAETSVKSTTRVGKDEQTSHFPRNLFLLLAAKIFHFYKELFSHGMYCERNIHETRLCFNTCTPSFGRRHTLFQEDDSTGSPTDVASST